MWMSSTVSVSKSACQMTRSDADVQWPFESLDSSARIAARLLVRSTSSRSASRGSIYFATKSVGEAPAHNVVILAVTHKPCRCLADFTVSPRLSLQYTSKAPNTSLTAISAPKVSAAVVL